MQSVKSVLSAGHRQADWFMCANLWGLFVTALALSGMRDTLQWALVIGLPAALLPTPAAAAYGGTAWRASPEVRPALALG